MRVEYETVKPKKRRTRRRMVLSVLEVVLLVVFVVAFYNVAKTLYDYKKGDDTYNDARATAVEQIVEVSPDAMQLDPPYSSHTKQRVPTSTAQVKLQQVS